ncbi:MAG TPA: dihydrofolate reductase family protein [Candidatus Limnocylindria bacterium]|nr:dihydrofolate reductase family protein [Candidatus Limnocylindria bacterium]
MGKVVYCLNVSLDGYIETADRRLDWATVDEEIHSWFNEQERSMDASLYGRRLYETMAAYWPTGAYDPAATPAMREFATIWNAKPIIVFSSTLTEVVPNARIVRGDVAERLAEAREEFAGDLNVGAADLAGQFVQRGLVDEYRLVIHPVVLGAGTPFWPRLEQPLRLQLVDRHEFSSGTEMRAYRPLS